MQRVNRLSEFQSHPGGLIAFLNDSAHYFQLYSSPLHGALPYPYRVWSPSLSVLLAQAWQVFNKPLEPECKIKSLGCNFKDASVFSVLTQEPESCRWHPQPFAPRALMAKVIAKSVLHWPRAWLWMEGDRKKEINRGGGRKREQLAVLYSTIPWRQGPSIMLLILCFSIKITMLQGVNIFLISHLTIVHLKCQIGPELFLSSMYDIELIRGRSDVLKRLQFW